MSLLVEILAWASIAVGTMITAWRLVSLTVGRSIPRRSRPAAHARPRGLAESGTGSRSWRELEDAVVLVALGVLVLDVNNGVTKWLMLGVIVILGPLLNLVWARSRKDRKPGPASL